MASLELSNTSGTRKFQNFRSEKPNAEIIRLNVRGLCGDCRFATCDAANNPHNRCKTCGDCTTFIYEQGGWPKLGWRPEHLMETLAAARHRQGRLLGRMEALGFQLRAEAALENLTQEVTKSSEIEGEVLDWDQVRSSIARRLGMDVGAVVRADQNVEGVVEMMLDATQKFAEPLTADRLFGWHAALFPTGRSGMRRIIVGAWRDDSSGPMQVVSGPLGNERVHFEAPPARRIGSEIAAFLDWFNGNEPADLVLKAGVAHLWFVTIHPFEDGNGRIARAIADLLLARSEETSQQFYSMSARICDERKAYYDILEATQKNGLDITPWLRWFLECLGSSLRRCGGHFGHRHAEGKILGSAQRRAVQFASAAYDQPASGRFRREAHDVQMGENR